MSRTLGSKKHRLRAVAAIAAMSSVCAVAAPAAASAFPTDSAGSSGGGSSATDIVQGGISIVQGVLGTLGAGSSGPSVATQQCNQSTKSGGPGVTDTIHQLGKAGPASFVLAYETEQVPDLIEVFYQGGLVHSTGYIGDNLNEGTGSAVIDLPPGADTSVLVRVTGPSGTVWDYTVGCPS